MSENHKGSIGVFVIVFSAQGNDNKILLVKNSDRDGKVGKWGLPGGGVGQGELVDAAAKREVKEETGLDVWIRRQLGIFSLRKELGIVILFEGVIVGGELKVDADDEIVGRGFFSAKDIASLDIYPAQCGLIKHALIKNAMKLALDPVYDFLIPPISQPVSVAKK